MLIEGLSIFRRIQQILFCSQFRVYHFLSSPSLLFSVYDLFHIFFPHQPDFLAMKERNGRGASSLIPSRFLCAFRAHTCRTTNTSIHIINTHADSQRAVGARRNESPTRSTRCREKKKREKKNKEKRKLGCQKSRGALNATGL